jgi:hypothetical protein
LQTETALEQMVESESAADRVAALSDN